MADSLAERLAEYAHTLDSTDVDAETVHETKRRVLDSIACAYAGLNEAPARTLVEYTARKQGDRNAGVIHGEERSIEYATLANGTLIRFVDWNDMYTGVAPAHPSDNLGPVLSVADAYDRSGQETILATVLAYEIQCQFADQGDLWRQGFDHVNYGLISSALAAGRSLDAERAIDFALDRLRREHPYQR
jgi:2-methylcitrate dehydratase